MSRQNQQSVIQSRLMTSGMRSGLMSGLSSSLGFDLNDEQMKAYLDKKVAQNKLNYEKLLTNLQPILMEETMQFLNREFESVKRSLTATHHEVLKSFYRFLERNDVIMKERDFMISKWK